MSVKIRAKVASGIPSVILFNTTFSSFFDEIDILVATETRDLGDYSINDQYMRKLVKLSAKISIYERESDEYNEIANKIYATLEQIGIDNFYFDYPIQIKTEGFDDFINLKKITKSAKNKKLQDLINPNTWISKTKFMRKYNIRGYIYDIPYENYDKNESKINCIRNYVIKRYKKIALKSINKYFKDNQDINLENIINFCERYTIKCIIYNVVGKIIYENDLFIEKEKRNFPHFVGMIANKHFYPCNDNKNYKPRISEETIKADDFNNIISKEIFIESFNDIITKNGTFKKSITIEEMDKEFYKGTHPNFKYLAEDKLKMKSLIYISDDIENLKYEIDMNKCYFNMAYKILPNSFKYPIFTATEMYEEFNEDMEIDELYYYLISESSLKTLKQYGITSNSQTGYIIKYLIDEEYLSIHNIEYYKKPTYIGEWKNFKKRIDDLIKNNFEKLKKEKEKEEERELKEEELEELKKKSNIEKTYIFYNGTLGISYDHYYKKINNVMACDFNLLNDEDDRQAPWIPLFDYKNKDISKYEDITSFTQRDKKYRYINTCNLYDTIVSQVNLYMLKALIEILKENEGAKLLKIKVDSLGFDREIEIPEEFQEYFKIVENPKIYTQKISQRYYNGEEIKKHCIDELNECVKNISYQGAPGTGKTTKVKDNHKYDFAMTLTNACALNLTSKDVEGQTVYSAFKLFNPESIMKYFKVFYKKTIWIDEFSMMPRFIWNYVFLLNSVFKTKFIISGDINQIGPIGEKTKIDLESIFFKKIMGKIEVLKKDHRNDEGLIQLRNYVLENKNNKKELYKKFEELESDDIYMKYDRHIAFTHVAKMNINLSVLKSKGYKFEHKYKTTSKQDTITKKITKTIEYKKSIISVGVILTCRITKKAEGIYKNDIWKVIEETREGYKLKNLNRKMKLKVFEHGLMKYFTLGFCTTAHSSQGLTIKENFCIHEVRKMIYMDPDILYTAITRGCNFDEVHIYNDCPEENDKSEIKEAFINFNEDEEDFNKFEKVKFI